MHEEIGGQCEQDRRQSAEQDEIDRVLLGALPAILLALAADFLMHGLTALLPRRAEP